MDAPRNAVAQARPPAVLSRHDCWGLLEDEEVARVAWAGEDGVAIVPVNYAVADGALWLRTQPYTALARECCGGRVAVEVDRFDRWSRSAWSVVVTGTAERAPVSDVPAGVATMEAWAPGPRTLFIRVTPIEVSGRRLWGHSPDEPEEPEEPDGPTGSRSSEGG